MLNGIILLGNRFERGWVLGMPWTWGILLVFWPEITDFEMGDENLSAAAIAVLATFLASLGNIASARNQHNGIPVIEANTYGMTYGALLLHCPFLRGSSLPLR